MRPEQTTTFFGYLQVSGHTSSFYMVTEQHAALFLLLKKINIKSIPEHMGWTLTTTSNIDPNMMYQVTGSSNSITITTTNHTAKQLPCTGIEFYDEPKNVKKCKPAKGFSRDEKRAWRDKWKHHSKSIPKRGR